MKQAHAGLVGVFVAAFYVLRLTLYFARSPDVVPFEELPWTEDFNHYYASAVLFRTRGAELYCADFSEQGLSQAFRWHPYIRQVTNPPPLVMLTSFLGALTPVHAWRLWIGLLLLSLVCTGAVVFLDVFSGWSRGSLASAWVMFLLSFPVLSTLRYAQVQPLLLLLVVLGWRALRKAGSPAGAAAWGIAAGLKLFLWPLILLLGCKRRWWDFAAAIAAFAATLLLPVVVAGRDIWHRFSECAQPIIEGWAAGSTFNISLSGVSHRLALFWGVDLLSAGTVRRIFAMYLIPTILMALTVVILASRSASRRGFDAAVGVCVTLAVLAAPVSWPHYFVFCLLPFAVSWRYSEEPIRDGALLLCLWVFLPLAPWAPPVSMAPWRRVLLTVSPVASGLAVAIGSAMYLDRSARSGLPCS